MKTIIFIFFLLLVSSASTSALAKDINTTISQNFPGWKVFQQVEGDLNGDGKVDVAALLYKSTEENSNTSKTGQTLLVVYLNDGQGGYQLNTQAPEASCDGCGGMKSSPGQPFGKLSIQKGQLHVLYEGGSRNEFKDKLKWRFDQVKKQFFLVGETYYLEDTVPQLLEDEIGSDHALEVPDGSNDDDAILPNDTLDINYLTLKAKKTIARNHLTQKNGKSFVEPKPKKDIWCIVPSTFKNITLSDFNYEDKHINDITTLLNCEKKVDGLPISAVDAASPKPIDLLVETLLSDESIINPAGDFFRAVLLNSEKDACVHIQRVNARASGPPKILETKRYCNFTKGFDEYSLDTDQNQDSEINKLEWKNHILNFMMSYVAAKQAAPRLELQCTIEPGKTDTKFQCSEA
jgi:hypothetical protein